MRFSLLLTSALIAGALARPYNDNKPLERRLRIVTETEVEVVTVVVTITAGRSKTTSASSRLATPSTPSSVVRLSSAISSRVSRPSSSATPAANAVTVNTVSRSSSKATSAATSSLALRPSYTAAQPSALSDGHVPGTNQAFLSAGLEYQAAVLYHHNRARANHNAAPLTWDTACESNARIAAERCVFEHYIPSGAGQGQNLFTISGRAFNVTAGITESWYKSELPPMMPHFGQDDVPDNVFHSVGHLTQLVWKGTTRVGCVSIDCGTKMIVGGRPSTLNKYTVCNYAPAGNVHGRFATNVVAPNSLANLGGWAD